MRHAKTENYALYTGEWERGGMKQQRTETAQENDQVSDFKVVITNMFKEQKETKIKK